MMDYRMKQSIFNALKKLIESAPKVNPNIGATDITMQELKIWIDYINSVMDISYNFTKGQDFLWHKTLVERAASNNNKTYIQRVYEINDIILDLARSVMQY